ncbi:MAG: MFS transporter [Reyranella sp.]
MLALLAFSRFGAGVATMVYAGTLPFLLQEWDMSGVEGGSVQSASNLSYAISLLVCSWASDRIGPRKIFVTANWFTAAMLVACTLFARSYESGLILFSLLALGLGGSYTPAIMLVARHLPRNMRGRSVGVLLTGASLGYFFAIAGCASLTLAWGYATLWLALSVIPLLAAIGATFAAPGPSLSTEEAAADPPLTRAMLSRNSVLLTAGYTAHCWELLGMWAWTPAFLAFAFAERVALSPMIVGVVIAGALHVSGAAATLFGGWASDRWNQRAVLVGMGAAGALLSVTVGWTASLPPIAVVIVVFLYGFAALGDSGVLSAAMADAVAPGQLGRMLALRSILGLGADAVSPAAFGIVLDLVNAPGQAPSHWGWAFAMLGGGGLIATAAALLLKPSDFKARQLHRAP